MDQYPVQTTNSLGRNTSSEGLPTPSPNSSSRKLFLPIMAISVILMLTGGILGFFLFKSQPSREKPLIPSPTRRPTATPFPPPTIPLVTTPVSTVSATITPGKEMNRLIFIREGDIYRSDLSSFSLLVKNATPAADKLSWSPLGNFLAWRPKSATATSSTLMIYRREYGSSFTISRGSFAEIVDYAWSPDESRFAAIFNDSLSFSIHIFSPGSFSPIPTGSIDIPQTTSSIKQILWPNKNTIIFSGDNGIFREVFTEDRNDEEAFSPPKLIVSSKNILNLKLSPQRDKLLYSVGDNKKGDLYLINIDGTNNQLIPAKPAKVNMGETNLPDSILDNGFIPYAIWMPSGNKLLVGYHYLPSLPLVGIYDLKESSFSAIAPFLLKDEDLMIDDFRLLGARVSTISGSSLSWQLFLFTFENNAKMAVVKVIPNAHSPAFFTSDVNRQPTIQEIR